MRKVHARRQLHVVQFGTEFQATSAVPRSSLNLFWADWLTLQNELHIGLPINICGSSFNGLRITRFRTSNLLKPHALPSLPLIVKSNAHPARSPIILAMLVTLSGLCISATIKFGHEMFEHGVCAREL